MTNGSWLEPKSPEEANAILQVLRSRLEVVSSTTLALVGASFYAFGCLSAAETAVPVVTEDIEFMSAGRMLSGITTRPASGEAKALIVFVHGSGPTNVRAENSYFGLPRRFAELGIASVMWDKPGMGRSEGRYDPNQPLEESAREVLDALAFLRDRHYPGTSKIGLWGASRAGWVAPIAMSQDPDIEFWISVSGVPAEDNKYYLMKSNLPLEGRAPEETDRILAEWKRGRRLFMEGADYDTYLAATENLRRDPVVRYLAGDLTGTKAAYEAEQLTYMETRDAFEFDEETLSVIRVTGLHEMLSRLEVDVLALFGDRDTNVDWQKTRALYESTIGRQARATLSIRAFEGCNHVINQSETGSAREVATTPMGAGVKCEGYFETQLDWLREYVINE